MQISSSLLVADVDIFLNKIATKNKKANTLIRIEMENIRPRPIPSMKLTGEIDTISNDDLGGVMKELVGVVRIKHVKMRKMRKSMNALEKKKNSQPY